MRFVICGVGHETNTFSSIKADRDSFRERELAVGNEIIRAFKDTRTEIGGFIEYCEREGIDFIPTLTAFAEPSGKVTTAVLEEFLATTISMIKDAGAIDAVLARLHGAMVSEDQDDGEGYFLKRIREVVGSEVPIVSTLDFHSNITKAMIKYADILVGYDTYPHVDCYERGLEAAELARKMVAKEITPTVALEKLPFWPPTQKEITDRPPMKEVMEKAFEYERKEKVVAITISTGFAWSDIEEMGFGVVVTTDNDQPLAERLAKELASFVWERREKFLYAPVPVDEAVEQALRVSEGPIILADIADNPGGGTPCDGTVLLKSLLDHNARDVAFALIRDPEAVKAAIASGVGSEVTLNVGGKIDRLHGSTLTLTGKVRTISDGIFIHKGPMNTGTFGYLGRTVVFSCQGIDILLTENRVQPYDREVFRRNGITPEEKKIIVVKSSAHFRADYESIAKEIIEVGTPGLLSPDLTLFDFKKIPRPFYPLDRF